MKTNLLILADDLTGALDTGVQFAKAGIDVEVIISPELVKTSDYTRDYTRDYNRDHNRDHNPDVLVINLNTRHASPQEARAAVTNMTKTFNNYSYYYKKTDSCLRGNIGAELEALMNAAGNTRLPFVPAFPGLKRTTKNGFQYLNGELIHKSSMANDPLNPITESFIPAVIAKQSAVPVILVNQTFAIPEPAQTSEILVFDGETFDDLKKTANLLWENNLLKISAGCAGFAEVLMETLPFDKKPQEVVVNPSGNLPILIISGSLHPVSVDQIKTAKDNRISGFCFSDEKVVLQPQRLESKEAQTLLQDCTKSLLDKGVCILGTEASFGKAKAVQNNGAENIPSVLGEMTRKIIDKTGSLHLVVFGGDTLQGIMKAMRYNVLKPLKEIQNGIALARAQGQTGEGLLVTKAGAFGDKDIVSSIVEYLKQTDS